MTTRRKLKEAIANNEELSFVFGQSTPQKIVQTAQVTKEQLISLEAIVCTFTFVPDSKPVRHYYEPDELQQWALNDIKPNGIRSPLWVRPHPSLPGKYELVAGLRRLRAAEIVEIETVPVKVFDWDDRTAFHAAISENANRRDFSALEELDNTLRLLEIQLGYDTEEVISFLYRLNNATKKTTNQNVLVSPQAQQVQQIFDAFGRITWQSFVATRLPLLKKPTEILTAIRQGEIHYTKGILIASVKDAHKRQNLLEEAISQDLSLSQIKQRIKALIPSSSQAVASEKKIKETLTRLAKSRIWEDTKKQKKLNSLLEKIEALMSS